MTAEIAPSLFSSVASLHDDRIATGGGHQTNKYAAIQYYSVSLLLNPKDEL